MFLEFCQDSCLVLWIVLERFTWHGSMGAKAGWDWQAGGPPLFCWSMGSIGLKGISARFLEGINSGLSSLNQNQMRWVGSFLWWDLIKQFAVIRICCEPSKRPGFLGGHDGILWGIVLLSQMMLEFVEETKLQTQYKQPKSYLNNSSYHFMDNISNVVQYC